MPPDSHAADRNLLFGIVALQMGFISRDQLIAAMQAWVFDKRKRSPVGSNIPGSSRSMAWARSPKIGCTMPCGSGSARIPGQYDDFPFQSLPGRRQIERRVGIKESIGTKREADGCDWHYRPILNAGDVRQAEGVPQN